MALPSRSEIVIIGGGVIGVSIAYHLARRGKTDVTLVERKALTEGSTWHAAGLVGQLRSSANLTQLMRKSVQTYQTLEDVTGYPTGWHGVGGLRVASSPQRWEELQRVYTQGKSYGFDLHLVGPREAKELFPLLNTDGVYGATWTPSDGYVDPTQLTQSFAAGARAGGVRIVQQCRVESIERDGRRVTAVLTEQGRIECDVLVNATGMWGAETARLAGVDVAVNAVEHQYVVTEKSDDLPADLPTFRDPDARFYLKPEAGALVIGGWEEGTRACWRTIPRDMGPTLFPANHERFEGLGRGGRQPLARLRRDGHPHLGQRSDPVLPRRRTDHGAHRGRRQPRCTAAGSRRASPRQAAPVTPWPTGSSTVIPEWTSGPSTFAASAHRTTCRRCWTWNRSRPTATTTTSPSPTGRAIPRADNGAARSTTGCASAARSSAASSATSGPTGSTPATSGPRKCRPSAAATPGISSRPNTWPSGPGSASSIRARSTSSRSVGRNALALLQRIAGADMDSAVGKVTYTQLLNERGGIEADVTITRLTP